tara:strand:- start:1483 stop:1626 length:144 start_codon:yes stop_codon:yes gene_type:complete
MNEDKKFIKKIRKQGVHPKHITKYDIQQKIKERELLKQNDDQNSKTS